MNEDERDDAFRALGRVRDAQIADLLTLAISIAAEKNPEQLRAALAATLELWKPNTTGVAMAKLGPIKTKQRQLLTDELKCPASFKKSCGHMTSSLAGHERR